MSHLIQYRQMSTVLREIRLLQIDTKPAPRDPDDALRCSVRHIVLDSQPQVPYTAMSYCWGPVPEESHMTVDGKVVRVPQSAVTALRSVIREPGELIWIDAVCINQQDIPEKGRQVAMMKDIYTHANEVRIWLGTLEDDDVALRAIEAARRIHDQCLQETNHLKDLALHLYGREGGGFKYSDAALPADCDWNALRELYSLPWFTRLWVVQEVALARKATCYVGKHTVDADVITLAARWMVHRKYPKYFGGEQVEGIENASSMYHPTARPLSNQLRRMHRQRCKDDRDRVYGLLGILSPPVAAAIVPDYSLPLIDVYVRAHRVSFEESGSLELLRLVAWYVQAPTPPSPKGTFQRFSDALWRFLGLLWGKGVAATEPPRPWPSWVAKVHAPQEHAHGSCLNVQTFDHPAWPLQVRDLADPFILSVKGLDVSAIVWVSDPFTRDTVQDGKKLAAAIRRCLDHVDQFHGNHGHGHGLLDENELRRELMLSFNCGINAKNADAEKDEDLPAQYDAFVAWCKAPAEDPSASMASVGVVDVQAAAAPEYSHSMWRAINRRLFVTADGRLGMGPYGTQKSDHAVILSGTQGVFILRSDNARWTLIGDAYCRRLMKRVHLDAWLDPSEYDAKSQWFDIC